METSATISRLLLALYIALSPLCPLSSVACRCSSVVSVSPGDLGALGGLHGDEGKAGLAGEDGKAGDEFEGFHPQEGFARGATERERAVAFEDQGARAVLQPMRDRVAEIGRAGAGPGDAREAREHQVG